MAFKIKAKMKVIRAAYKVFWHTESDTSDTFVD